MKISMDRYVQSSRSVRRTIAFFLALWIAIPVFGFAHNILPTRPLKSHVRFLPEQIQISQSQVNAFVQDGQGFIWMATQYGLNRYDGTETRVFLHAPDDPDSVGCNYIQGLFSTSAGQLWVRCGSSLDQYDPKTEGFHHFYLSAGPMQTPAVFSIAEYDSKLLLGTSEGVVAITPSTRSIKRIPLHSSDPYWTSNPMVFHIEKDRHGRWWVLTQDHLAQFDPESGRIFLQYDSPRTNQVGWFHQDRWDNYWLIAGYRLYRFDLDSGTMQAVANTQNHLPIAAHFTIEDRNGDMWFATEDAGVMHLRHDTKTFEQYSRRIGGPSALPSDRVTSLLEDQNGDIWVGFHDVSPAIIQRDRELTRSVRYYPQSLAGLHSPLTTSITSIRSGELLIATSGALQVYDEKSGTLHDAFAELWKKDVFDAYRDSKGRLWIATDKGIARQRPGSRTWEWLLQEHVIDRILLTPSRDLWILSRRILWRYNEQEDSFTVALTAGQNEEFYTIAYAPDKDLWLGGSQGLHRFQPMSGRDFYFPYTGGAETGPGDPRINSVLVDQASNVWLGTQSGLERFDAERGRFEQLADKNHPGGQIISCILEDRQHRLWMSSNQGILSYDPHSGLFDEHSGAFGSRPLDLSGWGACTQLSDDQMFFGGFDGVFGFFPNDVLRYISPASLLLTSISVNNQPILPGRRGPLSQSISFTDEVRLRHDQNDLSFGFTNFNYRGLNKPQYEYRLRGVNDEWLVLPSQQSSIGYSHLLPGAYTLEFRARGDLAAGEWAPVGRKLRIVILKPWWLSWWMYLISCLLICALARLAWVIRMRQLRAVLLARVEGRVRERTAVARDIHDTLLQDMQGVVLRCESIVIGLGSDNPYGQALSRTIERAEQSIAEGRDALQAIRTTPVSMDELASALQEAADDLSFISPASVKITTDKSFHLEHHVDAPEIFKIGREAVRNALQHAQASRVRVHISCTEKRFQLEVEDNGIGMKSADAQESPGQGHWGIIGMRERAERIGGEISIMAAPGKGTLVRLTIPIQSLPQTLWQRVRRWIRR